MMTLKELKNKIKTDMSGLSVDKKYLYLRDIYLNLYEYPELTNSYTVDTWLWKNFEQELNEIKKYNQERGLI